MTAARVFVWLKWLWMAAVLAFVAVYFYHNQVQLTESFRSLPKAYLLVSFLLLFLAKLLLVLNMRFSLESVGRGMPFAKCAKVYIWTHVAKYIPGNIWQFVTKAGVYAKMRMEAEKIKDSMVIEIFWEVFGAFLVAVAFLSLIGPDTFALVLGSLKGRLLLPALLLAVFLSIGAYFFFIKKGAAGGLMKNIRSNYPLTLKILFNQVVLWVFIGLSLFALLAPFLEAEGLGFYVIGLFCFSYIIGFVTPFAPAGLGIRETLLVAGMSPYLPAEAAVMVVGLHRVVFISAEALLLLATVRVKEVQT